MFDIDRFSFFVLIILSLCSWGRGNFGGDAYWLLDLPHNNLLNEFFMVNLVDAEALPNLKCYDQDEIIRRCCEEGPSDPMCVLQAIDGPFSSTGLLTNDAIREAFSEHIKMSSNDTRLVKHILEAHQFYCCADSSLKAALVATKIGLALYSDDGYQIHDVPTDDPWKRLWPRVPASLCVLPASMRLFLIQQQLKNCFQESPKDFNRSCADSLLSRTFENALTDDLHIVERHVSCFPSQRDWNDIFLSLRATIQSPGDTWLGLLHTIRTINSYVFEINDLLNRGISSLGQLRVAAVPLAAPMTLHHDLSSVFGLPHRGSVLLRLATQIAQVSRPRGNENGLTIVELGVGQSQLSQWFVKNGLGLIGTLHMYDLFEHDEWAYQMALEEVSGNFSSLGFLPCAPGPDAMIRSTAMVSLCGPLNKRIYVHRDDSAQGALAWPDQGADLVFVDAGHSMGPVLADIEAWWPKLSKPGVMAGHDFRFGVGEVRQAVVASIESEIFLDSDTVWWTLK